MSDDERPVCGIVMPISAIDGCTETHWSDVLLIISEAVEDAGFDANIVSNADDVGIIQKRIIQNLYENPIVVCDVSGKNPNVMFELGMRLAFDKPTIIIKDDATSYSFDTSPIEHLEYPRDLRFSKIVDFKDRLTEKIKSTYSKSVRDKKYTTFLKHFGEFTVAKLETKEVSGQEYILEELKAIRRSILTIDRPRITRERDVSILERENVLDVCLRDKADVQVSRARDLAESYLGVVSVSIEEIGLNHQHMYIRTGAECDVNGLRSAIREVAGSRRPLKRVPPKPRQVE